MFILQVLGLQYIGSKKGNPMKSSLGYRKNMAKNLAVDCHISVSQANRVVEKTLSMIVEIISKEGRIELRNFGVFERLIKPPKKGRNPKTGADIFIPKKYKVKFKPGKQMISKIIEENNKKTIK